MVLRLAEDEMARMDGVEEQIHQLARIPHQ
jgi:hypothetical protein